jgi:hypothetical protein
MSQSTSFDPQIIWDSQTSRFYYVMDSVFSPTDNRISLGFSKTGSPANLTTDWCHYTISFGTLLPDYPKLGDSQYFLLVGFNGFNPAFVGSQIVALRKPPAGTGCPVLGLNTSPVLASAGVGAAFTPVPANQIDTNPVGYVVARDSNFPTSTNLTFFSVTRDPITGNAVFGAPRGLVVPAYSVPPAAVQPGVSPLIDTLDARNTQAVQALDALTSTFSFWTQHTIANGAGASQVRYYEIDPVPAVPVALQSPNIAGGAADFLFNAAISPNRAVYPSGGLAFGDSFVVEYNVSSTLIDPRIVAGSSRSGAALLC